MVFWQNNYYCCIRRLTRGIRVAFWTSTTSRCLLANSPETELHSKPHVLCARRDRLIKEVFNAKSEKCQLNKERSWQVDFSYSFEISIAGWRAMSQQERWIEEPEWQEVNFPFASDILNLISPALPHFISKCEHSELLTRELEKTWINYAETFVSAIAGWEIVDSLERMSTGCRKWFLVSIVCLFLQFTRKKV